MILHDMAKMGSPDEQVALLPVVCFTPQRFLKCYRAQLSEIGSKHISHSSSVPVPANNVAWLVEQCAAAGYL